MNCVNISSLINCWLYLLYSFYSFYPECFDKFQDWVPPHQRKEKSLFKCMYADCFRGKPFTFVRPVSSRFLSVGKPKKLSIFGSNLKRTDTVPTHFSCLSNYSQPPWVLWNGATVYDQKYSCLCCFIWRAFWTILVNCGFINNHYLIKLERVL